MQALSSWGASLAAWADSLRVCADEIDGVGPRVAGRARWDSAVRTASDRYEVPDREAYSVSAVFAVANLYEDWARNIALARDTILDPAVVADSQRGMSRTYSENIRVLGRNAEREASAANALYARAMAGAAKMGAALVGPVDAPEHGVLAMEIYVSALLCRALAGSASDRRKLELAKDISLGVRVRDGVARAYHPAQMMCYAPLVFGACPATKGTAVTVLDLPQARLVVKYDLGPLINKARALEYGPIASMVSGLSYRTVQRLQTIKVERAATHPDGTGAGTPGECVGPVRVEIGGATVCAGPPPDVERWAPFAGPKPRIDQYASVCEEAILARIHEEENVWSQTLKSTYERAVADEAIPSGAPQTEALIDTLASEFEKTYARKPPETPGELYAMAVGADFDPRGYVCAAVSRAGAAMLDEALARALVAGKSRAPYQALEREARLTQALHALDAAKSLWRALRKTFRPGGDLTALPPVQRRAAAVLEVRRAAAQALTVPLVCLAPSLKLFSALNI